MSSLVDEGVGHVPCCRRRLRDAKDEDCGVM